MSTGDDQEDPGDNGGPVSTGEDDEYDEGDSANIEDGDKDQKISKKKSSLSASSMDSNEQGESKSSLVIFEGECSILQKCY